VYNCIEATNTGIHYQHLNSIFQADAHDAIPGIRCLEIKFSNNELESPLDLVLYTGETGMFLNEHSERDLVYGLQGNKEELKSYLLQLPIQ